MHEQQPETHTHTRTSICQVWCCEWREDDKPKGAAPHPPAVRARQHPQLHVHHVATSEGGAGVCAHTLVSQRRKSSEIQVWRLEWGRVDGSQPSLAAGEDNADPVPQALLME